MLFGLCPYHQYPRCSAWSSFDPLLRTTFASLALILLRDTPYEVAVVFLILQLDHRVEWFFPQVISRHLFASRVLRWTIQHSDSPSRMSPSAVALCTTASVVGRMASASRPSDVMSIVRHLALLFGRCGYVRLPRVGVILIPLLFPRTPDPSASSRAGLPHVVVNAHMPSTRGVRRQISMADGKREKLSQHQPKASLTVDGRCEGEACMYSRGPIRASLTEPSLSAEYIADQRFVRTY
ncbi:hypothetical protein L226DRAFT_109464 [Lentinus tigrinus ALCF2SS1-7]|uniref:Uncharacterized protein n=1 Tax=Lentinus tigrinus ALCF2SS1-6 TaxID=1328759 RepID=A0A5C2S5B1_9APHY|nr:hypothetical protein L227DRAFT_169672 [Lentinus tigrinus ALCF2SS1-6]RPD73385.1 hypothetical protein L226DRAFT_109464 [Lentinus tigrinus ALCF2SS1-7]